MHSVCYYMNKWSTKNFNCGQIYYKSPHLSFKPTQNEIDKKLGGYEYMKYIKHKYLGLCTHKACSEQ